MRSTTKIISKSNSNGIAIVRDLKGRYVTMLNSKKGGEMKINGMTTMMFGTNMSYGFRRM